MDKTEIKAGDYFNCFSVNRPRLSSCVRNRKEIIVGMRMKYLSLYSVTEHKLGIVSNKFCTSCGGFFMNIVLGLLPLEAGTLTRVPKLVSSSSLAPSTNSCLVTCRSFVKLFLSVF